MTYVQEQPSPSAIDGSSVSTKSRVLRAIARRGAGPTRFLAGRRWFPLWGVLRHVGRTSGRQYAFPVATQRVDGGFLVPIPFGDATQWVRNVLAAGGCTIRWRGRDYALIHPRVVDWAEARPGFGGPLRAIMPVIGLKSFMRVDDATS